MSETPGAKGGFETLPDDVQKQHIKARIAQLIEQSDIEARHTGKPKVLSFKAFRKHCSEALGFNFSQSKEWKATIKELVKEQVGTHEANNRDGSIFKEAHDIIGNNGSSFSPPAGSGFSDRTSSSLLPFQNIHSPSIYGSGALYAPRIGGPHNSPPRPISSPPKAIPTYVNRPTSTRRTNSGGGSPFNRTNTGPHQMPDPGPIGSARVPSPTRHLSNRDAPLPRSVHSTPAFRRHLPHDSSLAPSHSVSRTPTTSQSRPQSTATRASRNRSSYPSTPARASDDRMRYHRAKTLPQSKRSYSHAGPSNGTEAVSHSPPPTNADFGPVHHLSGVGGRRSPPAQQLLPKESPFQHSRGHNRSSSPRTLDVQSNGEQTRSDRSYVSMADPSVWRWKGSSANNPSSVRRHSALEINQQIFDDARSAHRIGTFSKPRHERSPPPPKGLSSGPSSSSYSRRQVANSVRYLNADNPMAPSVSSMSNSFNPSNSGGGRLFDPSTSSPAQRLFEPGTGQVSDAQAPWSRQVGTSHNQLHAAQQQVNVLCREFGIQAPHQGNEISDRILRVVFSKDRKLGLSFMNFNAEINFFGIMLNAQIRKVSSHTLKLGVRPGMVLRYIFDWDCANAPLEEVRNQLWAVCQSRPVIITFAIPQNIPLRS